VEVSRLPNVFVGFVIERGLAGGDVFTVEGVVGDVLCGPEEFVNGVFEKCSVLTVHVERDGDSPAHFHTSYV
jgi:hypothetical protein